MVNHDQSGLTLLAFLTALRKELQSLSSEAIMERLLKYGETIPQEDRAAFLFRFSANIQQAEKVIHAEYALDESLTKDVDTFVEAVESQSYVEGYDWDHHTDEIFVWGDESWVDEMAALFARIDDAFFAADFSTAASEYPKLLKLFSLTDDNGEGYFPGEGDPEEMLDINLQETVARYLRSLLSNAAKCDTEYFISELAELSNQFYAPPSFQAILEASTQPFNQTEQFMCELEAILVEKSKNSPTSHNPDWGKLLRETVSLRNGIDGLSVLAHEQGATMPECYYEWILALRGEGRDEEALQATWDGIEAVNIPLAKGVLANALATLLDEKGAHNEALLATQLAWRSNPTLFNLKGYLAHGNPDISATLLRLDEEYSLVKNGDITFSPLQMDASTIRILLLALAGDYDLIALEAQSIKGVGWSSHDHIGYPAYTALLLASLEPATLPPTGSYLQKLLQSLEERAKDDEMGTIIQSATDKLAGVDIPTLLIARLNILPEHGKQQSAYRQLAKQIAYRRVHDIVSNQHRNAYERAANIAVAFAEMLKLSGHSAEALVIPTELTARFPRHTAFRGELKAAWRTSSVVRSMSW